MVYTLKWNISQMIQMNICLLYFPIYVFVYRHLAFLFFSLEKSVVSFVIEYVINVDTCGAWVILTI